MQPAKVSRITCLAAALAACALALPAAGLARHGGGTTATTLAASGITSTSATLNGSTSGATPRNFRWGLTTAYGNTATAAAGSGAYSATISGLAPGTTYHFLASVDGPGNGADRSFTTLAAATPTPPGGNATPTAAESADLAVAKTVNPPSVTLGSTAAFRIVATNVAGVTVDDAVVTDQLPAGLSLVKASSTQGSCSGTSLVTCAVGPLPSGRQVTITVVVTAVVAGAVTNTAEIGASNPDPNIGGNNHSSATLMVTAGGAAITTSARPGNNPPPPPGGTAQPVVRSVSVRLGPTSIAGTVATRPTVTGCSAGVTVRLDNVLSPATSSPRTRTGKNGAFSFPRPKTASTYRVTATAVAVGGRRCLPATSDRLPVKAS